MFLLDRASAYKKNILTHVIGRKFADTFQNYFQIPYTSDIEGT